LEDITRSIPQLYNSSWKAAITDVLAKNAQILQDRWLSDIRLDAIEQVKGQRGLAVHVGTTFQGSVPVVVNESYPIDGLLNKTLAQLHGQLSVTFSVTGPYFPSAEQELYYITDPYFHNLGVLVPQINQALESQFSGPSFSWFSGKSFSSLVLTLLDQRAVRLDMGGLDGATVATKYFASPSTETTRTVTNTVTNSVTATATASSTLTVTQPPQTSTMTTTVTTALSGPTGKSVDSSGYVLAGVMIALVGLVAAVAIVRRK
jgi:hypothetical protein